MAGLGLVEREVAVGLAGAPELGSRSRPARPAAQPMKASRLCASARSRGEARPAREGFAGTGVRRCRIGRRHRPCRPASSDFSAGRAATSSRPTGARRRLRAGGERQAAPMLARREASSGQRPSHDCAVAITTRTCGARVTLCPAVTSTEAREGREVAVADDDLVPALGERQLGDRRRRARRARRRPRPGPTG